ALLIEFGMKLEVTLSAFPYVSIIEIEVRHKHGLAGQRVEHTTLVVQPPPKVTHIVAKYRDNPR
ncbi:MAG: hypothetical protein IIT85_08135, partial [Prevotella sp.]|nr:hypothetical protein [Prevotella sp.]